MSGIGGRSTGDRLITDKVALPDSIDSIISRVREILLMGSVQNLSMEVGGSIVYTRIASQDDPDVGGFVETTVLDQIKYLDVEEFSPEDGVGTLRYILNMWGEFESLGLSPAFLVVAPKTVTKFWEWVGVRRAPSEFLGASVVEEAELNEDVFLVCGASSRAAAITEVSAVLKGSTWSAK